MKKHIISGLVALIVIAGVYVLLGDVVREKVQVLSGQTTVTATASSTVFAITSSASQQLVSTSTKRVALEIQPLQCDTNIALYLKEKDVKPTAYTGYAVIASTTEKWGDNADLPVSQFSVRGITGGGNCDKVLVTEWRSNF